MGSIFGVRHTIAILFLLGSATANAESWELRHAADDVPGSTEIEAGEIEDGIRILLLEIDSASSDTHLAVLENLCVAYAIKLEYDIAMRYCDQAVGLSSASASAFNNRGVLRAVIDDHRGAIQDFRRASCMRNCSRGSACEADSVQASIRRNLARVKQRETSSHQKSLLFQPRV